MLEETRLEEAHHRKIEHIEPDDRLIGDVSVVVKRKARRDDEITSPHDASFTVDLSVGPLTVEDEADRGCGMQVTRRDLAGQDELNSAKQRIGRQTFAWHAWIFQNQHAAHRVLGGDEVAGRQHQPLRDLEAPDIWDTVGLGLLADETPQLLPKRRHVMVGDLVVKAISLPAIHTVAA